MTQLPPIEVERRENGGDATRLVRASESQAPPGKEPANLSVIVPVFNEARTLHAVLQRLQQIQCVREIIVVDDASTDGSCSIAANFSETSSIRFLRHEANLGKGAAIRTAAQHVTGPYVVIQDADLEYDPLELDRLTQPLRDNQADVVFGSRFAGGAPSAMTFHRFINRGLTRISNLSTGLSLSDMETCYKAMRSEVLRDMVLRENRFGFEPEITAKIARGGWRVMEMPISYAARSRGAGKKIGVRDGFRALWCIARYSRWD